VRDGRQRAQLVLRVLARVPAQTDDLERHLLSRALVLGREHAPKRAFAEQRAQHTMPADRLTTLGQLRGVDRRKGRRRGSRIGSFA